MKTFLYDFEITNDVLVRKLKRNILKYFEETSEGHYICKGYEQPLLVHISNKMAFACNPFEYHGSYTYKGQNEITLHSRYGIFHTYKKMVIFGLPFMVCTDMTEEEAVLAAMTDVKFVKSLIQALA